MSLYQVLSDSYGIRMTTADEVAEASLAGAEDARLLQIKKSSPVFVLSRICYAGSSEPVEFVRSIYRGDRWKLVSRLTAGQNSGSTVARRPVILDGRRIVASRSGKAWRTQWPSAEGSAQEADTSKTYTLLMVSCRDN